MYKKFLKRLIDVALSVIGIIVLALPMLIIATLIKITDPGPVFFKQKRVGLNKTHFNLYKFRSMKMSTPKDCPTHLLENPEQYITSIGKILRKSSLDELPQLFNILKGEMSFIGPRPERPEIIKQYMEEMPEFAFRMKVKAGLAGYAQVYGKYNTTPYDKLKLDLSYIENYSVWLDIKLMLLTLKILLSPESTEGIDQNQVTAMKKEANEDSK